MIRENTRQINVGGVLIGGQNKVVIQSMTNTKTKDMVQIVKKNRIILSYTDYERVKNVIRPYDSRNDCFIDGRYRISLSDTDLSSAIQDLQSYSSQLNKLAYSQPNNEDNRYKAAYFRDLISRILCNIKVY